MFAVPTLLVDRHIKLAGGAAVKVLLCLLRHSDRIMSSETLADSVGISSADAEDAISYWQSAGLICPLDDGSGLIPAELSDENIVLKNISKTEASKQMPDEDNAGKTPSVNNENNDLIQKQSPPKKDRIRYSYSECSDLMRKDADLRHMLAAAEAILGKQLNHTEISVFVTLCHWYGMPAECIAVITEHCKSIGKTAAAYIEATVTAWWSEGINTLELVQQKIDKIGRQRSAWGQVRQALEIPGRKATAKESLLCDRWMNEYNISAEMLKIAYDKCVDKKGKLSMSYIDGIIKNWKMKGIFTPEAAIADKPAESKNKNNPNQKNKQSGTYEATYDIDEIESLLDREYFS